MAKKNVTEGKFLGTEAPGNEEVSSGASSITLIELELSPLETQVLELAHELMEAHYIIIIRNLYSESVRRIKKADKFAIMAAINGLMSKKIIFEGKAITRDTILQNQTRRAIYQLVMAEPGIYFSKIKTAVQKDSRTVGMHLGMLLRFNLIRSREFDNNFVYFDANRVQDFDYLHYMIHKKHVLEVFKALLWNPGISFDDLCNSMALDTTRGNFMRKVNVLVDAGFLSAMRNGNQIVSLHVHSNFTNEISNII